jgi:hypothetical protein
MPAWSTNPMNDDSLREDRGDPPAGWDRGPARSPTTPLQELDHAFVLLVTGPQPLSVDGRLVGHGLPRRPIPLDELRALLLHPATGRAARDVAWRLLVTRARTHRGKWVVGAAGVALPGLRRAAARLMRGAGWEDVEAELRTAFLEQLHRIDLAEDRVATRLCNAAYVAARAALRDEQAATAGRVEPGVDAALPPMPWGHPDLVLARAVAAGVISAREARVIGTTRLEQVSLTEYATATGSTYLAVQRCRQRGEARLVAALRDGLLSDPTADTIHEATTCLRTDPEYYTSE